MLNFELKSISEVLGHEFTRRRERNKSYSLRAYARDLCLSPSRLSEVLNGKQGLSEKSVDQIAEALTKKATEREFLRSLVLAQFSRNQNVRNLARERVDKMRMAESFRQMRDDQFRILQDWYHGAILELIQVQGFDPDPAWIAHRLGIPATTAKQALQRLQNMGLVEPSKGGKSWIARPEAYQTFSDVPSRAIRHFHSQILNMHADSLREDDINDREFLSMILAVPRSRLSEFKQEMYNFATRFWQKIENEPKDDLYSLSLQLCPVRNRRPEKKSGVQND